MKKHKLLIVIVLVAAILRFVGIYPGYNQFHPDEQMSYATAAAMIYENTFLPKDGYTLKFAYPYLVPLINFFFFKYVFAPLAWITYFLSNIGNIVDGFIKIPLNAEDYKRILQLDVLGYRYVNTIFWARTLTAFFGVGNVILTYFIAKIIADKRAGLIAALILTFNFRQVTNSHIALPDVYNSFFLLLSVLFSIRLYKTPSLKRYITAGIASAIAFNVKFQFFAFAPFFLVHLLLAIESPADKVKKLLNPQILIAILFIPLITLIINPYHFINFEQTLVQVTDVALKYGMGTKRLNFFPFWYLFNIDLGAPLFLICILGIVFGLIRRFKYSLIVFSVVGFQSFIFFYYSTGGFHIRNIIPLTPFLIILAAVFVSAVTRRLNMILSVLLVLAIIYIPARNVIISDYFFTKPWNFTLLSNWLYQNPLDGVVASNPTDPPTGTPPIKRSQFSHSEYFSMAEHLENDATYALINTDWAGNEFYNWMVFHPGNLKERWEKPLDELRNRYHGLALEEMLHYQIFASLKSWQAPEANLILVEFPNWSGVKTAKIYEKVGIVANLQNKAQLPIFSTAAKEMHLYKVSADLTSFVPLKSTSRDGFLRVDVGSTSCVSARVNEQFTANKSVYCLAPKDTTELKVSLQIENHGTKIQMNNFIVEESLDTVKMIPSKYPYIDNKVELELIYPNSHANL